MEGTLAKWKGEHLSQKLIDIRNNKRGLKIVVYLMPPSLSIELSSSPGSGLEDFIIKL